MDDVLAGLLREMLAVTRTERPVLWFYTPQMWPIAHDIDAAAVVCDCMDELSNFRFAPSDLQRNEAALIQAADVVFTGGHSLYEARRGCHDNIHAFPSSVDATHFAQALTALAEPVEQAAIPRPRLGYYGVIDERLDLALIRDLAAARPDWQIVIVGPVAKIAPEDLPKAPNLHWMGARAYGDLPA